MTDLFDAAEEANMIQTVPAEVPQFQDQCPHRVTTDVGFTAPYPTLPCYLPRGHEGLHRMGVEWTSPKWVVLVYRSAYEGGGGPVIRGPFDSESEAREWAGSLPNGGSLYSRTLPIAEATP